MREKSYDPLRMDFGGKTKEVTLDTQPVPI
jgi:hypothetical protein